MASVFLGAFCTALLPAPKAAAANTAIWPTSGIVTGYYGWRCQSGADNHKGYDIANATGTNVVATQPGTISSGYNAGGYGNYLIVTHANGWSSLYGHLHSFIRTSGNVVQGEHIGEMGSTGGSSGPHLHFEMRKNGVAQNFNSTAACNTTVTSGSTINFTFAGLSDFMIANVTNCGALYIKQSYWGQWQEHMGCGQAKEVSISPDGNTIAVVRPDNTLIAKQGYWGTWAQHVPTGDSQSVSAGPNGMIGSVNVCGAVWIKTSYWGQWQEHMGCGQAKEVSIAPNGQMVVVRRPDGAVIAKETLWGNWAQHTGSNDSKSVAAGPNGMIANVNGCGAVWIKTSYWGNWTQHSGCDVVKVSVTADGQGIAAVNTVGAIWTKSSYNAPIWERHTPDGSTKSVAMVRP